MKAFVTRNLPDEALAVARAAADIEVWPDELPPSPGALAEAVADCDGLLCLLTDPVDSDLLSRAPRLRVVSQMAVGYDNIDVAACTARGIKVGNTPGVLTETTADLAFALLMAAARRITESERYLRDGKWQTWSPMQMTGPDIHHATLGIIGLGRIGYEVARRARGFQMRILYANRRRNEAAERDFGAERVELGDLLAQSDFVSVHAPLTPDTRHLIGAPEFSRMKPSAVFVNTSRGPVVDQRALYEALRDRRIAAAGIDVFQEEPLPMDDPLLTLGNVVLLPHIGSASIATRTRMAVLAAENLAAGLRGEPLPYPVN